MDRGVSKNSMKAVTESTKAEASKSKGSANQAGLKFSRYFSKEGTHPFDEIKWTKRKSVISNADGSVVSGMDQVEVPADWSQLATDIVVSKYFRKSGVARRSGDIDAETSVRQVVTRIASSIRKAGERLGGYFKTSKDAETFEDELTALLVTQRGAFNSPVWFNCGLYEAYGITGSPGSYYWNPQTQEIEQTKNAYQAPQCSACFIQSVNDDLMSIFELVKNEARLFKYGSGTGTNFSHLRGKQEKLSGGGLSSGLISFLEVLDRGAGATKSGGTTRRAAKMVCLDMDHPEIVDFIQWKSKEEKKAKILIQNGYPSDFNGEAYRTVAGQNSNNSIRVSDDFMNAVQRDENFSTRFRTNGEVCETFKARDLWRMAAQSAWDCADPGVQYDTTINRWHTSKATDKIYASNPCSEYMFLNDSACNLASLNLMKFWSEEKGFDIEGYRQAIRVFSTAQEILVDYSSYPTKPIAQNSHDYRPLGLGYANLGTLLMVNGLPYDSHEANQMAGALTAILTGHGYRVSAEIAGQKEPFPGYERNRESMLEVMDMHRDAAYKLNTTDSELIQAAQEDWDMAVSLGEKYGYRNAQMTVLAPTGTIGLLMDCDTTGVEPDFALVKFKKLAGGGSFKIINNSVPLALKRLGYKQHEIEAISAYVTGTATFEGNPYISTEKLLEKGLSRETLKKVESKLAGSFDLSQVFSSYNIGESAFTELGIAKEKYSAPGFNLLKHLGFSETDIEKANDLICGAMTVEGAPYLKTEHYGVFDCANKCGKGERFIAPMGHVRMMAAAQPFISGAISKTVNLPNQTTVEEIEDIYFQSWKLGLKAVAVYRDGCKSSQPLSTKSDKKDAKTEVREIPTAQVSVTAPSVVIQKKLPKKRSGFTQEARVAGHKVYLRTGEYPDGSLGEIFIDMHKEGAALRSMMNCFAIAVSMGLQHGVPLETFVEKFIFTRFEPQGSVDHPNIKYATSVIDYVFRVLGFEYLGRTDFVQVKPEEIESIDRGTPEVSTSAPAIAATANPANATNSVAAALTQASSGPIATKVAKKAKGGGTDAYLKNMMGDAPFCDSCGHTTVRNGSCYRCLNCGASMGCS